MRVLRYSILYMFLLIIPTVGYSQQYWGALAIDKKTGITGGSWDFNSKAAAINGALGSCINKFKGRKNDCKIVANFTNACAAIYWSPTNTKYAWATNDLDVGRAEKAARNACIKHAGPNCQKRISFCTTIIVY